MVSIRLCVLLRAGAAFGTWGESTQKVHVHVATQTTCSVTVKVIRTCLSNYGRRGLRTAWPCHRGSSPGTRLLPSTVTMLITEQAKIGIIGLIIMQLAGRDTTEPFGAMKASYHALSPRFDLQLQPGLITYVFEE